ncbi:MAG TPA: phosphotransferase [Streptosporangiaceae bacterium]|nr:phosphotransferase [Streptosporangiaceae bacterium]
MELLPHSYTNRTTRDGPVVTKAYQGPGAARRCAHEAGVLRALADRLPVPPVLDSNDGNLHLKFMAGVHGQELIDAGLAEPVLRACGQMLRRIHAIDLALTHLKDQSQHDTVLVHGDYGPNNVLLDPAAEEVTAILDWEWAHAGNRVEDLAWCEWIVRMHHSQRITALGAFFDAYGWAPAWSARKYAMIAQCRAMFDLCQRWQPGGEGVRQWRHRLTITESWRE